MQTKSGYRDALGNGFAGNTPGQSIDQKATDLAYL